MRITVLASTLLVIYSLPGLSAVAATTPFGLPTELPSKILGANKKLIQLNSFGKPGFELADATHTAMIFDLPVTYNHRVRKWIGYFQGEGRGWFKRWLERCNRHLPVIQQILEQHKLPKDLIYIAMIESGFSPQATSSAAAVGPWQFMPATGKQYGLNSNWWLDERRDFVKSTNAAASYFRYLYSLFRSWYLTAAAYNMGENRLKRLIQKYGTRDYWKISSMEEFAQETKDYVPKLMAAILIAKAPALYGFRDLDPHLPLKFDTVEVPGGIDLINLADHIGVTQKYIRDLNPELIQGFIPNFVASRKIRVPNGAKPEVERYVGMVQGIDLSRHTD